MAEASGPPTAFTALTVAGVPTMGLGGGLPVTNGNYYFVSSVDGSSANDGLSMGSPLGAVFGTGGAYAKATAANGDVIVLLPGHTETISSSTGALATKSGVSVYGIGDGALQPTFTIDTANDACITVSAANQTWVNCRFVANFLSIAAAFILTTAKGFTAKNCLFLDTDASHNFLNCIKSTGTANTVDGLRVVGCQWEGIGVTSVNTFVLSANAIDRCYLGYNLVTNLTTVDQASLLVVTTGVLTGFLAEWNCTYRKNTTSTASLISIAGSTSIGIVRYNQTLTLDPSTDVLFLATSGLAAFENYITGAIAGSGQIKPNRDT